MRECRIGLLMVFEGLDARDGAGWLNRPHGCGAAGQWSNPLAAEA